MPPVECRLVKIVMSESHDHQVVVLREKDGSRQFQIVIGLFEVYAIHRFVNDERLPRPFTHELIGNILSDLDVTIDRVVICDLRDSTYYARLILKQNGRTFDIDSRPSDAIALAVQAGAPLFVEEAVLARAAEDGV